MPSRRRSTGTTGGPRSRSRQVGDEGEGVVLMAHEEGLMAKYMALSSDTRVFQSTPVGGVSPCE